MSHILGIDETEATRILRRREALLVEILPAIEKEFGELRYKSDAIKINVAKAENALCLNCSGICPKSTPYLQLKVVVADGLPEMSSYPCPFNKQMTAQITDCGIPRRYSGKSLSDYEETVDNRKALQVARWYIAEKPARNVYYYGGVGTGKTMLASIIGVAYIKTGKKVKFANVPALIEELKNTFDTKESMSSLLTKYSTSDLLVLDDFGAGKVTDWSVGIMYQLVNQRYNLQLPMVVTSNYSLSELGRRLTIDGDSSSSRRIISRLQENTVIKSLGNVDRRLKI